MVVRAAGYREATRDIQLAPGRAGEFDFDLEQCGLVRGRILDENGRPWPTGRVLLIDENNPNTRQRQTTGLDGRFAFDHAPFGPQRLEVWKPGHFSPSAVRRIADTKVDTLVEVRLLPRKHRGEIRGRIVDGAGSPAAGIAVTVQSSNHAHSARVATDSRGRYSIATGIDAPFTVSASSSNRSAQRVAEIALGRDEVHVGFIEWPSIDQALRTLSGVDGPSVKSVGLGLPVGLIGLYAETLFELSPKIEGAGLGASESTDGNARRGLSPSHSA